ncbi:MAG: aspartate kinase [Nitrososphaerota archaeon]|nr:aspartate kinase [Candidatus Bathyarchaeota archaeon]MDW8048306.1 aspartate kinase [Nitrososphaerota archaeon]
MTFDQRVVIKFGGADLATGEKVKRAAEMVLNSGYKEIVVVVSAMGTATDNLINIMSQIGGINDKDYADIVSMGERTSVRIFSSALRSMGAETVYFDPDCEGWPIITDSNFKDAEPDLNETCKRVKRYIEPLLGNKIVVVCGFLGKDRNGNVTTLGRGGSDTTAMIIAHCLRAGEIILVKETEGVMSADPKVVSTAKPLEKLDIYEMFALSHGGAKVLKADALKYKLPEQKLRIVSFHNGLAKGGTEILGVFDGKNPEIKEKKGLMAVSLVCDIIPERIGRIFQALGNRSIYGISTGRGTITIFTSSEDSKELLNRLHELGVSKALSSREKVALLELTSPVFIDSPGWIAKISASLAAKDINIIEMTTSKATINVFIDESRISEAAEVVRDALAS